MVLFPKVGRRMNFLSIITLVAFLVSEFLSDYYYEMSTKILNSNYVLDNNNPLKQEGA
jgi:hypothetical protein